MSTVRPFKYCKVCLAHLRPDGKCVYKCDPALAGVERRRAERARLVPRRLEVKLECRFDRKPKG